MVALPAELAILALIVSAIFVGGITGLYAYIIIRKYNSKFWDFIREKDFHPSMARFQALLWSWVVLFVFLSVVLMRWFAGVPPVPMDIPQNLLLLMGVSAAPAAISSGVNYFRYQAFIKAIEANRRENGKKSIRELIYAKDQAGNPIKTEVTVGAIKYELKDIPLSDIFCEEGKPAMTRFQVFVWTFIAIMTYFVIFGMALIANLPNIQNLSLPDVDLTMVTLMGLSQGAYVAGKMAKST